MTRTRQIAFLLIDAVFYATALVLTLYIRYDGNLHVQLSSHIAPFTMLFIWWVALFYINDLYELEFSRNWIYLIRKILTVCTIATLGAVLIFYFLGSYLSLAPKTNLILFSAIFSFFAVVFRLYAVMRHRISPLAIILIGESGEIRELENHFGSLYKTVVRIPVLDNQLFDEHLRSLNVAYIIFDEKEKTTLTTFTTLMPLLRTKVKLMTTSSAYEFIFKKIPVNEISSAWFFEYIHIKKTPFDAIKRLVDIFASLVLIILLSPLMLICSLLVLTLNGFPIIYKQDRVGKNGELFKILKFRTMVKNAEHAGPQWSTHGDPRITKLGNILRKTHLDEMPQLISILRGEMSFVGPRPERAHFVESLSKEIPYFEIRHAIKPGLTGWAQIRHGYTSSTSAFFQKFQYDLYYIKNRSLVFDLLIILKTIRTIVLK